MCGLRTPEVARAFLVSETAMAARITRAKKKIAAARIPYRVPAAEELPERVDAVLMVVHLVFTTGHTAPGGRQLVRDDLVERSIDLARMLRALLPADREVAGAALADPPHERAQRGPHDRRRRPRPARRPGPNAAGTAMRSTRGSTCCASAPTGRFGLMAAIAAVHSAAPTFDDTAWAAIVDALRPARARVALARRRAQPRRRDRLRLRAARRPRRARRARRRAALATYGYLAAARADFLSRLGRAGEARAAYEEALLLTENAVERDFLERRLAAL